MVFTVQFELLRQELCLLYCCGPDDINERCKNILTSCLLFWIISFDSLKICLITIVYLLISFHVFHHLAISTYWVLGIMIGSRDKKMALNVKFLEGKDEYKWIGQEGQEHRPTITAQWWNEMGEGCARRSAKTRRPSNRRCFLRSGSYH